MLFSWHMIQRAVDYCRNYIERYQINRSMKSLIWETYDGSFQNTDEAYEKIKKIYELIDKAKEFNTRTSSKPLDIDRFTQTVYFLEQRIEDDYFSGLLPVK